MLGLYVSDHPLMGAEASLRRRCDGTLTDLAEMDDGTIRTFGGVVTGLQRKWTKKGDLMAVFALEDLQTSVEVMVFPKSMTDHGHKLADDAIVTVRARVDGRDDQPKLIAMEIEPFEPMSRRGVPAAGEGGGRGAVRGADRRPQAPARGAPRRLARCSSTSASRRCCGCPRRGPSTWLPVSSPSSACCSGPPRSWPERNLDPRVTVA